MKSEFLTAASRKCFTGELQNEKNCCVPSPQQWLSTMLRIKNANYPNKATEEPEAQRERNLPKVTQLDALEVALELRNVCLQSSCSNHQARDSQPGPTDDSGWMLLHCGAVLCTVGVQLHPRSPPTRFHIKPHAPQSCDNKNCSQALPNIAWGAKQLGTTALDYTASSMKMGPNPGRGRG